MVFLDLRKGLSKEEQEEIEKFRKEQNQDLVNLGKKLNLPMPKKLNFELRTIFFFFIFILIWILLGICAFITSLVCIGKSGDINDKTLGIIIASMLGPLYFIYLGYNNRYCRKKKIYNNS